MSGRLRVWFPTCDSSHLWWFYSASPLEDQATSSIMTRWTFTRVMTWSHSVILSYHRVNQYLPYPNNIECLVTLAALVEMNPFIYECLAKATNRQHTGVTRAERTRGTIIIISLFPHDRCTYKLVFISVVLHMKKEEAKVQYLWDTNAI